MQTLKQRTAAYFSDAYLYVYPKEMIRSLEERHGQQPQYSHVQSLTR